MRHLRLPRDQAEGRRARPAGRDRDDQGAARRVRRRRAAAHRSQLRVVGADLDRGRAGAASRAGPRRLPRGSVRRHGRHGRRAQGAARRRRGHAAGLQRRGHVVRRPARRGAAGRRPDRALRPALLGRRPPDPAPRPPVPDVRPRPVDALEQPSRRVADGHDARRRRRAAPDLRLRHALSVAARRTTKSSPAAGSASSTAASRSPIGPGSASTSITMPWPAAANAMRAARIASATIKPKCAGASIRPGRAGSPAGDTDAHHDSVRPAIAPHRRGRLPRHAVHRRPRRRSRRAPRQRRGHDRAPVLRDRRRRRHRRALLVEHRGAHRRRQDVGRGDRRPHAR